jgi:hypothetical protein
LLRWQKGRGQQQESRNKYAVRVVAIRLAVLIGAPFHVSLLHPDPFPNYRGGWFSGF